jgi:HAMP domain-containing protein
MLKNLKLGAKLNLILIVIFFCIVLTSGLVLSNILEQNAKNVVASKAFLLMEAMSGVREYTDTQITPQLLPRIETDEYFLPQIFPGYAAREVFDIFRKREEYRDFFYKEAVLNPTNPRDLADDFEKTIIKKFRQQPDIKELTGFRSLPGGDIFYVARPHIVTDESCLRCHSTPSAAPKSLIATYGSENGFNWKLHNVVGTKIISTPASQVFDAARHLKILVIGILTSFFLLAILLINLFLKTSVTEPLRQMAQLSKKVSTGDLEGEFKHPVNDEIGILAASLNRMKVSLEMALNMLNSESK